MRLNKPAEIRQMGQLALAPQQQAPKLLLELLDCSRQRRLRDIAQLRRPREVQGIGHRQKVADLVHFHTGTLPRFAISHKPRPRERRLRLCDKQRASKRSPTGISVARATPLILPHTDRESEMDIRESRIIRRAAVTAMPLAGQKALVTGA